ncbi:synaptopodin 2-like protein isoform X2 [Pantherophis guttatus]|uniref:Synaptopodin 2-like protein isoform X2 n=1 Tax=Pantherophis guttatus TaxID=94885 RepID=A0ABM3ZDD5_PANGU|nr:synaptopodin 2-like protein isoform X2 [Pantherophis guttatus]
MRSRPRAPLPSAAKGCSEFFTPGAGSPSSAPEAARPGLGAFDLRLLKGEKTLFFPPLQPEELMSKCLALVAAPATPPFLAVAAAATRGPLGSAAEGGATEPRRLVPSSSLALLSPFFPNKTGLRVEISPKANKRNQSEISPRNFLLLSDVALPWVPAISRGLPNSPQNQEQKAERVASINGIWQK